MIDDRTARRIAAEWHGGQGSPLYALASTGSTTSRLRGIDRDHDDVLAEIDRALADAADYDAADLTELYNLSRYVTAVGDRGPQEGWMDR